MKQTQYCNMFIWSAEAAIAFLACSDSYNMRAKCWLLSHWHRFIPWHQGRLKFSLTDGNCQYWFKNANIYNICPSAFWQLPNASCPSKEIAKRFKCIQKLAKGSAMCNVQIWWSLYLELFHFILKKLLELS